MKTKIALSFIALLCYKTVKAMEETSSKDSNNQTYYSSIRVAVGSDTIEIPDRIVELSQTLRNMQEDACDVSNTQEAIPFPSLPYVDTKYTLDFFKFLVNNSKELTTSTPLNPLLKRVALPALCTYLNLSSFFDIKPLTDSIQSYMADTIQQKSGLKKRFKRASTIQKLLPPEISTSIGLLKVPMFLRRVLTTSHPIKCIAISSDGKMLASGSCHEGSEGPTA